MPLFRRLTVAAVFFTFVQILLGGVTRLTGSGLACPDWPRCYGLLVPTPDKLAALGAVDYTYLQVMLEWTHRFNAGFIVGPLVLVLLVLAWRLRHRNRSLLTIMAAATGLLLVQAGIGGFTVLDANSPWSVAVHLVMALLFLAVLLLALLAVREGPQRAPVTPARVRNLALTAALVTMATVASGAMMAKSGASLACSTWPLCHAGEILPDMSNPFIAYHFGHRLLALATVLLVVAVALAAAPRPQLPGLAVIGARTALAAVALQVVLGAMIIWLAMPLWLATLHLAIGVVVFSALSVVFWSGVRQPAAAAARIGDGALSRA